MANHASHAALPYPIKGARFTLPIPYYDADGDPTDPITPDTEISRDFGAYADCTEEVTVIAGANGSAALTLTGDETNASFIFLAATVGSGPKNTLGALQPRVLPLHRAFTAAGGAAGWLAGDAACVALDDAYNGFILKTTGGTGGGGGSGSRDNQARVVHDYVGATRRFLVVPDWEVTPDATTTVELLLGDMAGAGIGTATTLVSLPSQIDIANLALLKLGDQTIVTFEDDTVHARAVKLVYPRVVDAVLRQHKWRFAVQQATLAPLVGSPTWRYAWRYQLPTDPFCLKVIRVSAEESDGEAWEIQGREILTNSATLTIEYIARITDPQQWDALFLEALTERLAAELAIPITSTGSLRTSLYQTYLAKVQEARTNDGFEGTAEVDHDTTLTEVR